MLFLPISHTELYLHSIVSIFIRLPVCLADDVTDTFRETLNYPSGFTTGLMALGGAVSAWLRGGLNAETQWLDIIYAFRSTKGSIPPIARDGSAGVIIESCASFEKVMGYFEQAGYYAERYQQATVVKMGCSHRSAVLGTNFGPKNIWQTLLEQLFVIPRDSAGTSPIEGAIIFPIEHLLCCLSVRELAIRMGLPRADHWTTDITAASYLSWLREFVEKEFRMDDDHMLQPQTPFAREWMGPRFDDNIRYIWLQAVYGSDKQYRTWLIYVDDAIKKSHGSTGWNHSSEDPPRYSTESSHLLARCREVTADQLILLSDTIDRLTPRIHAINAICRGGIVFMMNQCQTADLLLSDFRGTSYAVEDAPGSSFQADTSTEIPYTLKQANSFHGRIAAAFAEMVITIAFVAFGDPGMLMASYAARIVIAPVMLGPSRHTEYLGWLAESISTNLVKDLYHNERIYRTFCLQNPVKTHKIFALGAIAISAWILSFAALTLRPLTYRIDFNTNRNIPTWIPAFQLSFSTIGIAMTIITSKTSISDSSCSRHCIHEFKCLVPGLIAMCGGFTLIFISLLTEKPTMVFFMSLGAELCADVMWLCNEVGYWAVRGRIGKWAPWMEGTALVLSSASAATRNRVDWWPLFPEWWG
ncbi:hypothetical protein NEOLI_001205 [Neolecta irregularis DAH-3]|uniref:Uncharacterized protein n=1 Tax=Neolecta irregularis (strain DAH-3) TaxID=1198029 RepID=A0A1U7LUB6_NEOID|nr:hypothetical protein NEOLI_001205 [Neolecta irregularis DAH-3]|eukprot:OLL26173.1 hypothetical protein NEOLI_001205 [Neolecta irregularis DAH-3]